MNEEVLISCLMICLVVGTTGVGTFAFFSDAESSTGTLTAGTLDLKIHDNPRWDSKFKDGVTATWILDNMKPGDETSPKYITFKNFGSVQARHLGISCSYIIDEGALIESDTNHGNTADDMAKEMIITEMKYYGRKDGKYTFQIDLLTDDDYDEGYTVSDGESGPKVLDLNNDGEVSLYELKAQDGISNLRPPDEKTRLKMKIKFDEDAGNDYQGDMLNVTMTFTLR